MRKSKILKVIAIMAMFVMVLTACSNSSKDSSNNGASDQVNEPTKAIVSGENEGPLTVEITDINGTVTVPVNPKNVVALDNKLLKLYLIGELNWQRFQRV